MCYIVLRIYIPEGLQGELLDFARRRGTAGGSIFLTRTGKPIHRTYVNHELQKLCEEAGISREKGHPRCLQKLYTKTREELEASIRTQMERSYRRMIEREQATLGWNA